MSTTVARPSLTYGVVSYVHACALLASKLPLPKPKSLTSLSTKFSVGFHSPPAAPSLEFLHRPSSFILGGAERPSLRLEVQFPQGHRGPSRSNLTFGYILRLLTSRCRSHILSNATERSTYMPAGRAPQVVQGAHCSKGSPPKPPSSCSQQYHTCGETFQPIVHRKQYL